MTDSRVNLRILACQIDIPPTPGVAQRDAHLNRMAARIDATLQQKPADLVVLPELSSIDYSAQSFERLAALAEPIDGQSYQIFSSLARKHNVAIGYSFARAAADGYRICLAICGADGDLLGHYDKIYLAQFGASAEKNYFLPGDSVCVVEIGGFRIAPIICADIRTPELCRTLVVDHGVEIILHSGAYYRDPSFHSWHHFAITRALENQIYFVSLNRAGEHYGQSLFVPPWVDEQQQPIAFSRHDEQFQMLEVCQSKIATARNEYPFLRDRRDVHPLA